MIINNFPGYESVYFETDKKYHNIYRNTDVGRGGYIISNPGVYMNVALLDVVSLHPHSVIAMNCFGDEYTFKFKEILDARVAIKHKDFDTARNMMNGRLSPYLNDESTAKDLAQALKIAINSVYGLTAASFDNPFKDPRNNNNIVALRGALFMRTLQDEVENRGFKIVAIKTDSIKIANATKEIIEFCMEFANMYGYQFEHEATYSKICQINDADYIALYKDIEWCEKAYGYIPGDNKDHPGKWTATGARFQVPYVFKTLFSHEKIEFKDMCETFSVSKGDLYLDMNENLPDVSEYEKELDKLESDYKKGKISDTLFEPKSCELVEKIKDGHSLQFVGRVGQFTPILPGNNGGILYRVANGKNYAASGSTGYRWLESEMVKTLGMEDCIDRSFYNKLVDDAVEAISQYCDFEWFCSDDPLDDDFMYIPPNAPEEVRLA